MAKDDRVFTPTLNGHANATDLLKQVNQFNEGFFCDGTSIKHPGEKFCCGVACYPEKHEEAPNLEMDMQHLLEKQKLGAAYAVTQLFYDNQKFYDFVDKARKIGITIPIIPALKPFAKLSQLTVVPKTFHCDIPEDLAQEVLKCKTDEDAKALRSINACLMSSVAIFLKSMRCVRLLIVSRRSSGCSLTSRKRVWRGGSSRSFNILLALCWFILSGSHIRLIL